MRRIPESRWEWYGQPAHFKFSFNCHFHMATVVGEWIISTVGQYLPPESEWKFNADQRGPRVWRAINQLSGTARVRAYLHLVGFEHVGVEQDEVYETMAFWLGKKPQRCSMPGCHCGVPGPASWCEVLRVGSATPAQARTAHMHACELAATGQLHPPPPDESLETL